MAQTFVPYDTAHEDASSASSAPRGWYPDPTRLRYWDGRAWTDVTRAARPPSPAARVAEATEADRALRVAPVAQITPITPIAPVAPAPPPPPPPPPAWSEVNPSVAVAPTPSEVEAVPEDQRLGAEMFRLLLVIALAVGLGTLVTAVGIALTV